MLLPTFKKGKSELKLHILISDNKHINKCKQLFEEKFAEHHELNISTLKSMVTGCTRTILHSTVSAIQIIKNTSTNRDFTTYRLISTE